ncbi:hypothetical protein WUBG_03871 [Wuchereria bancrofti]|uniref:Uncharacterized protein n=1 Tax=Wuchereria bancrofti TaxID=6293 RepID=J9ESQ3_WUCBA|nr:hypothetical protein WUBG_03871 [Wuchereria bancrofti]
MMLHYECTEATYCHQFSKLVLLLLADSSKTSKASQNRGEMHLCAFLWRMKFERSVRTSEECKEKRRAERKDGMEKAEATSKQHTAQVCYDAASSVPLYLALYLSFPPPTTTAAAAPTARLSPLQ